MMHHIAERSLITHAALCVRKYTSLHNYAVNQDYKNYDTSHCTQTPHAPTQQILYTLIIQSENLNKLRVGQQGWWAWNSFFVRNS